MNRITDTERAYYGVKEVGRRVQDNGEQYSRIADPRSREINEGKSIHIMISFANKYVYDFSILVEVHFSIQIDGS